MSNVALGLPPNAQQPPPGVDPIDLPYYRCSLPEAVRRWRLKLTRFDGRASRAEFWWVALVTFVGWSILDAVVKGLLTGELVTMWTADAEPTPAVLVYDAVTAVLSLLLTLSLNVRRLHDINRSGWWQLAYLPALGFGAFPVQRLAAGELGMGWLAAFLLTALVVSVFAIMLFVWSLLRWHPEGVRFDRQPALR